MQKAHDDDVYLRLQHPKGFHNLVYMSYIKYTKKSETLVTQTSATLPSV
jgi:hypothetical protein